MTTQTPQYPFQNGFTVNGVLVNFAEVPAPDVLDVPAYLVPFCNHRIFALFNLGEGHQKGPATSPRTGKTFYSESNADSLLTLEEAQQHRVTSKPWPTAQRNITRRAGTLS
jgi:hypothetical protein